jgi:hypothetical protein
MFDSGLLISWGDVASEDRHEDALLRLFSEVIAYHDKLLEERRISGFEPFVIGAHGGGHGGLRGFVIVRGTPEQITTVRHDSEFLAYVRRAMSLLKEVRVEELYLGDALRHMMEFRSTKVDVHA